MVPLWEAVNVAVAAVKVPVVEPSATVTEVGSVNPDIPLLFSVTTAPPVGAGFESVTVQLLVAFEPKFVELHCSEESTVATVRLKFTVCDEPL
jgi:hypothetical protein